MSLLKEPHWALGPNPLPWFQDHTDSVGRRRGGLAGDHGHHQVPSRLVSPPAGVVLPFCESFALLPTCHSSIPLSWSISLLGPAAL